MVTAWPVFFSAPLYFRFGTSSARVPDSYERRTYGPEPSTWLPLRSSSAGYLVESTIAAAPVASFCGKVASLLERLKVIVRPSVVTESRVGKRPAGPTSDLIVKIRSKECLTSSAVIFRPLEKVRSSRSLHWYVWSFCPTNAQLSAASGSGTMAPGLKVISDW